MPLPLEQLQSGFAAALIDSRVVSKVFAAFVAGDERVLDRFGLYRGNVSATWEKALTNAFPVVRALVGEDFFAALARAYGRACPSVSGDLNGFGVHFADFVADFEHTRPLPYLEDVAALEWAVHCAYYAADADAVPRSRIASLPPHDLLAARFALHPACSWFESRFPVASIWLAHQPHATIAVPDSLDRREFALVVRACWRVNVLASSAAELAALEKLQSGADIDATITAALRHDSCFDLALALLRWLDHAVLVDMCTARDADLQFAAG